MHRSTMDVFIWAYWCRFAEPDEVFQECVLAFKYQVIDFILNGQWDGPKDCESRPLMSTEDKAGRTFMQSKIICSICHLSDQASHHELSVF